MKKKGRIYNTSKEKEKKVNKSINISCIELYYVLPSIASPFLGCGVVGGEEEVNDSSGANGLSWTLEGVLNASTCSPPRTGHF